MVKRLTKYVSNFKVRPSLDSFHKQVFDKEEADGVTVSVWFFLVLLQVRLRILLLIVNNKQTN